MRRIIGVRRCDDIRHRKGRVPTGEETRTMITVIMTQEDVLRALSAPAEMSPGRSVMWVLTPEDASGAVGDSVRAVIQWDSEQTSLSAEAVDGRKIGRRACRGSEC